MVLYMDYSSVEFCLFSDGEKIKDFVDKNWTDEKGFSFWGNETDEQRVKFNENSNIILFDVSTTINSLDNTVYELKKLEIPFYLKAIFSDGPELYMMFFDKSKKINLEILVNDIELFRKVDFSSMGIEKNILEFFGKEESFYFSIIKNNALKNKELEPKIVDVIYSNPGDWDE